MKGNFEGLVLDENNNIVEGMMSNIFFINKKKLFTPEINFVGIQGIMRQVIIEKFAHLFDKVIIEPINKKRLNTFDFAFLTNSIMGVMPVRKIEDFFYKISPIVYHMNSELKKKNFLELN